MRFFADGELVIGDARSVGGADFAENGAALGHDVGNAESVADFDQLATRDDYFGALGESVENEKNGSGIVVDDDGRFRSGPLQGQSVNIKWYLKREGLLDTTESDVPDYYLVLTGPPSSAVSSRGTTRPWCIEAVFLFDARQLRSEQIARGVKRGVASSVIGQQWDAAEIYPSATGNH